MSVVSWDDIKEIPVSGQSNFSGEKEQVYAELKEGSNFFRIIEEQVRCVLMYYAFGRFQKSSDEFGSSEETCPLSKEKDEKGIYYKARPYYLFKAIDRQAGKVKILRVGRQVANNMKACATDKKWGPLIGYDINIRKGARGQQPLYIVMPDPKSDLSEEDKEMIAGDMLKLEKYDKPAMREWVDKFIKDRKEAMNKSVKTGSVRSPVKEEIIAQPAEVTDEFSDSDIDNI